MYLALEGGPPCFRPGSTCQIVLRNTGRSADSFVYGTFTLYGPPSQMVPLLPAFLTPRHRLGCTNRVLQPPRYNALTLLRRQGFGLLPFRSPLLRESRLISSPPGTKMFQFPGFASTSVDTTHLCMVGSPIRVPPDLSSVTAPRRFSQKPTPFFASRCLVIHRRPLLA